MVVTIPHPHRYGLERARLVVLLDRHERTGSVRLHRAVLAAAGPISRLRPETIDRLARRALDLADGGLEAGRASASPMSRRWRLLDDLLARQETGSTDRRHAVIERVTLHVRQHLDRPLDVAHARPTSAGTSRAISAGSLPRSRAFRPPNSCCASGMQRAARLLGNGQLQRQGDRRLLRLRGPELFCQGV